MVNQSLETFGKINYYYKVIEPRKGKFSSAVLAPVVEEVFTPLVD